MWPTLADPKNLGLRLVFAVIVYCTHQLGPEPTILPSIQFLKGEGEVPIELELINEKNVNHKRKHGNIYLYAHNSQQYKVILR